MPPVLAIDVGGTKLATAVVDDAGALFGRRQAPTRAEATADALLQDLVGLARASLADAPSQLAASVQRCGVGCGGPMEPGGIAVSPLNIPAWRDFPLAERLSTELGFEVSVDNDAKALALGEGWKGAARGARNYLAMVVSTGVGGGLVIDGRLLHGELGNAGHIGHVIVEPDGRECACGAQGCLEAHASGPNIAHWSGRPPESATPATIDAVGTWVGRAVASVTALLDLRLVLVGGSVALGFGEPFYLAAQHELERRARLEFTRGAVIRPPGLGADGPLVGAAAVASEARRG